MLLDLEGLKILIKFNGQLNFKFLTVNKNLNFMLLIFILQINSNFKEVVKFVSGNEFHKTAYNFHLKVVT